MPGPFSVTTPARFAEDRDRLPRPGDPETAVPWAEPPQLGWEEAAHEKPRWRRNLFRRVLDDQAFLLTTWWPSELRRPVFTAPVVLSLAGATNSGVRSRGLDREIQRRLVLPFDDERGGFARGLTTLGDGATGAVLLGGSWLVGRWTHDERLTRASSLSAEALLNTALYTTALKRLTRRTRPAHGGSGAFLIQNPEGGQQADSFPSGHAAGAFAVATVFASEYRHRRWVPWVAYGTAGLISWSRVRLGRHFPSDVAAGAFLGRSMGRMVLSLEKDLGERGRDVRLEPLFDPVTGGVGLSYRASW